MSSSERFIHFTVPDVGEDEIAEVVETLRSGWITTGPKAKRFEEAFAAYLNAPGALALNSCTAGLHTALLASDIGPGSEVVTTTMTFVASVNVIEHVGAHPVLVDVEPDTLNLDPAKVEAALTGRTRAVLPVHYAGHPADLDPILELSLRRDLQVVEDAAHALPAKYKGRPIGSGGNPAAFSFYATKNLTTGEGGMLTGGPEFLDKARVLSLHGMTRNAWTRYDAGGTWRYDVTLPGYKYNMSDIQASIGLHQLDKLDRFRERRREVVTAYNEAFEECDALELPAERPEVGHSWHLYVIRLRLETLTIDRDRFIEELRVKGIGTSVHFIPIHLHPFYRNKYGYRPEDFPVAYGNFRRLISLPLYTRLTDQGVAKVSDAVLDVARTFRR